MATIPLLSVWLYSMSVLNSILAVICNRILSPVHRFQMCKQDVDRSPEVHFVFYHSNRPDPYVVITMARLLVARVYLSLVDIIKISTKELVCLIHLPSIDNVRSDSF